MDKKKHQLKVPFSVKAKKRLDSILANKKRVISFLLLGILVSALTSFILPKKYEAISRILFKYNSVNSVFLDDKSGISKETDFITSETILNDAINRLSKININIDKNEILNSIEITKENALPSFLLSVVSNEAIKTSEITNSLAKSFEEYCSINNRRTFINFLKSIDVRRKALQNEVKKRNSNKSDIDISSLNSDHLKIINQIAEFESELESLEIENQYYLHQSSDLKKLMESRFPNVSSQILSSNDNELNSLQTKLARLETISTISNILTKLKDFKVTYPWNEKLGLKDISSLQKSFDQLVIKLAKSVSNDKFSLSYLENTAIKYFSSLIKVNSIDLTKSMIFTLMTELENKFNRIPYNYIDIARQTRTNKFNRILDLKLKSKQVRLNKLEKNYFAEIESVSKAKVPQTFFSPNITLNILLGIIVGLLLGVFFTGNKKEAQLEFITSHEELEGYGYQIISQIPSFPSGSSLLIDSIDEASQNKLSPEIINSFSSMESFLKYGNLEKTLKTIVVTSYSDGEGKSVIASNIAIALANSGNKVLLVDADLKTPQLHKYFKVKSTPSLAHYLFRKKELDEIVRSTHNKNLDLITCIEFPQNPSVIISSDRMMNFMETVVKEYDYIVYDSTSLNTFPEATAIAKIVDEIIVVVRENKTRYTEFLEVEALLNKDGISNFNIVLNDTKIDQIIS